MASKRILRICFDRVLEGEQLQNALQAAFEERFENPPILPPRAASAAPPTPFELALLTRSLWKPGRTLHVRFLDGELVVQQKVEAIAHMWEDFANIKLMFDNDPNAEIRISFTLGAGSWSYLGTDALTIPKNMPTMNYGWLHPNTPTQEYHRVVLHEFGHALGCIHEHQNPVANIPWNKEAVYRAYGGPPNNWTRQQVDVNLFQKYGQDQTQFSEFDRQSIMLYPIQKELTDGVFEVGWNSALSETDKTFINHMYPKVEKSALELTIGAAPTQAEIGAHGEEDLFTFRATSSGNYTIETSGRTDVVMGLFGPNDFTRQIAQDDDSGLGLNAKISRFLEPGEYAVRVRHFRPRGVGKYGIAVMRSD